ncbi:MAG: hypothetical protein P1U89_08310 [Verrucomicrobiales bacterium]|nr:hypothetical protein [Verrucomicrobiales bacterium]
MATEGKISGESQKRYSRLVDMWAAPGLNPTNIDVLTKLKSAEDRQFSKNMAITGKIFDKDTEAKTDDETHIIGIRTDIWKPSKEDRERSLNAIKKKRKQELKGQIKASGRLTKSEQTQLDAKMENDDTMSMSDKNVDKARLVLKLFRSTGKNINWKGSLEELTVREVHQSIGSRKALITFAINLPGYEYLVVIQQCRRFFRPAVFSFAYLNDKTDEMWYIDVKKYWVSWGIDYHVEAQGKRIGKIDGKLLALGTDSRIKIKEPSLAQDQKFIDLLTLFSASIGFHKTIWKNIRKRVRNVNDGSSVHIIEDEELWLLKNPRRVMR